MYPFSITTYCYSSFLARNSSGATPQKYRVCLMYLLCRVLNDFRRSLLNGSWIFVIHACEVIIHMHTYMYMYILHNIPDYWYCAPNRNCFCIMYTKSPSIRLCTRTLTIIVINNIIRTYMQGKQSKNCSSSRTFRRRIWLIWIRLVLFLCSCYCRTLRRNLRMCTST